MYASSRANLAELWLIIRGYIRDKIVEYAFLRLVKSLSKQRIKKQ